MNYRDDETGIETRGVWLPTMRLDGHLEVKEPRTTVTLHDVARVFGRQHKDLMKSYYKLRDITSPEFMSAHICADIALVPMPNGGHRAEPTVRMDKAGFELLMSTFKGKKAHAIKERYIEAFNKRESLVAVETAMIKALGWKALKR